MLSQEELEKMKDFMNYEVNEKELVDINDIVIDEKLSKEERMLEYLKQIKNPYTFKVNGVVVHIEYDENGKTFEECMKNYFNSL